MIQVNGMPDHIHLLVGLHPEQSPASLVKEIKIATSKFINAKKNSGSKFAWQEGYGAFSYSKSHLPYVIRYIQNQKIHHRKHNFLHEYRVLLSGFQIDFEERYIFKELE